jgi:glycosyltransferase involved in cell wall biosynthesis
MPIPITVIVLTKNEETRISTCMDAVKWADEVLVVDSFSTDATVNIASAAGARVLQHPFSNFAAQHNYAQSQATHDWVFFVDADERVSDELRNEIKRMCESGELAQNNAYHIQRVHLFSGRWFPDPTKRKVTPRLLAQIKQREVPRLINRTVATWERPLHEEVRAPEPHGILNGIIYHYSTTNLSASLEKFNHYTNLEAAYLQHSDRHATVLSALYRGFRAFAYQYFVWGMFRYGQQGLMFSILMGMHKFMNYAKLWERWRIQNNDGTWIDQDRALYSRYEVDAHDGQNNAASDSKTP